MASEKWSELLIEPLRAFDEKQEDSGQDLDSGPKIGINVDPNAEE